MDQKETRERARMIVDMLMADGLIGAELREVLSCALHEVSEPIHLGKLSFEIVDQGSPMGTAAK